MGDEIDGQSQVAEPPRATDAVQVGLRRLGEVKIDDYIHRLDVNAPRQ